MLPSRGVRSFGSSIIAAAALLTCLAAPAAAQDPDPNTGGLTVTGGVDFTNAYMFRGIRQETEGVIIWPYIDLGATLYTGEGSLKAFSVNMGLWNSLHAGGTSGTIGPARELWYESDFYATASFAVTGGVVTSLTYTAYTSPNNAFATAKELSFKVAVDDSSYMPGFSLKPYGLIASEFDTGTGTGQADGGARRGTYLELGIAPGYKIAGYDVSFPIKTGIGLSSYYENPDGGEDGNFGFASAAAIVTVPFTSTGSKLGQWNIHGGAEVVKLGGVTRRFMKVNGAPLLDSDGDYRSIQMVYTIGLGFSY